jgi:hypothetical protein
MQMMGEVNIKRREIGSFLDKDEEKKDEEEEGDDDVEISLLVFC